MNCTKKYAYKTIVSICLLTLFAGCSDSLKETVPVDKDKEHRFLCRLAHDYADLAYEMARKGYEQEAVRGELTDTLEKRKREISREYGVNLNIGPKEEKLLYDSITIGWVSGRIEERREANRAHVHERVSERCKRNY
jgi:hypothetical protein